MLIKELVELFDILDSPQASGQVAKDYLLSLNEKADINVNTMQGAKGSTDFIKIKIPGSNGKTVGGKAPTLGVVGRLGGLGARTTKIGFVSDGDGALAALTVAAKLLKMQERGDVLEGDVIVSTHICPNAPTSPHKPVPFMGSPVSMVDMNAAEVDNQMDAILSIDTTKGNRIINKRGISISPTVKEGYILKVSNDLMDIMQTTTGMNPEVFALSQQDITPYGNDLFHINSILQPATATNAPVVGVAIGTQTMVAGCATGASHFVDVEEAARFAVEVAKAFSERSCYFYDENEFEKIVEKYGKLQIFQTKGKENC